MIKRYPSIAALADDAERQNELNCFDTRSCGHETAADSLRFCRQGDTSKVPEAERLINQIEMAIDIPRAMWNADICGAYPIVPEFLAGIPDCMRRRQNVADEFAPVNIYVTVSVAGALSAEQITKRGTAILALLLGLSQVRAVSLHVIELSNYDGDPSGDGDFVTVAQVNSTPLDIATAAYVLTSPAFFRRIMFGIPKAYGAQASQFPRAWHDNRQAYNTALLTRLGGDPKRDLYIDATLGGDALVNDPVRWVQNEINRLTHAGDAL